MGTVSGSSVANVVGTGSLTIPMMKKLGYHKDFAGAVEAAASTGGQLMPPVMGAAAFLMAEFVGVPYIDVVKAAVVPALLYFAGVWLGVHFEAKRKDLKGIPRSQLPKIGRLLRERGHLALPLVIIVYLLVSGYTPMRAALVAIVLAIVCSALRKSTRMKPIEIVRGLENGARNVLGVLVACAAAGIIIGVVTKTGVGLKLASGLLDLSGGLLLPTMFFTMITAIVLGMGVPTTANYVITSTIAAPALVQMGVPVLAAHMFVFYFGIIADVTPPVALAAYAGSGISGGNPLKTGINASKLAIAAFIIPYMFVLSPVILMIEGSALDLCCDDHGAGRHGRAQLVAHRFSGGSLPPAGAPAAGCGRPAHDQAGAPDGCGRHYPVWAGAVPAAEAPPGGTGCGLILQPAKREFREACASSGIPFLLRYGKMKVLTNQTERKKGSGFMQLGIRLHDLAPGSLEERLASARRQGFCCGHLALKRC